MRKFYTFVLIVGLLNDFNSFGQIVAQNDTMSSLVGTLGNSNIGNVFNNNGNGADTLNSVPATLAQVNLTIVMGATPLSGGAPVPYVNPLTGVIVVPAGTPGGTYTITYQICELVNPTNCDTAIVTIDLLSYSISLLKDGTFIDLNGNGIANPGDIVSYSFVVTNTGNVPLIAVYITDNNATVTGGPISLAAGASDATTFTAVHIVTQSDINTGYVYNLATTTGTTPGSFPVTVTSTDPTPCTTCPPTTPPCPMCTVTEIPQTPSINITMDGTYVDNNTNGTSDVGDTVVYNFVVTNTGNVPLTNIAVTSNGTAISGGPIPHLPVGASNSTTFTGVHEINLADVAAGQVDRIAIATGIPPSGPPVTDTSNDPTPCSGCTPISPNCPDCTMVPLIESPFGIFINAVYSDYNNDGFTNVGDVINYQYTVSNYGTTPLTNVTITGSNVSVSGGPLATLAPTTSNNTTFTGVHVITQNDINNGNIISTVAANAFLQSTLLQVLVTTPFNLNISNGIKMNAFVDYNNNGVQNAGEPNFSMGEFHYDLNSSGTVHNIITNSGIHYLYETNPSNSYNLSYTLPSSYTSQYTVSTSSYPNVSVANGSGITTYNFAITQLPYTDLIVHLTSSSGPVPGFSYANYITFKNQGNQAIASGTITFNVNNVVSISTYPAGAAPTASGFTYNFTNLAPFETRSIYVPFQVPTIPTVSLGQLLTNSVSITIPANDINPGNNSYTLTQDIRGSYDPNDKQESHGGRILHSSFSAADYLNYTIQFENTGNANAINVRVNDILDNKLDETSIRMVAASHNYVLHRVGNNLNWRFDAIELPPSNGSPTVGHGYITFQIKPKPGYAIGDVIPNIANIYFDFNPAIVTPVCNTEFVATMGLADFVFSGLKYYPNPVNNFLTISNTVLMEQIEVSSVLGQQVLSQRVNALETELDFSNISNGIYFVKISSEGEEKTIKIIKE